MFFFNKIFVQINKTIFYNKIGVDESGNEYYTHKHQKTPSGKAKRICLYKNICEPSIVPPIWHAWLHYTINTEELNTNKDVKLSWYKRFLPNLAGTPFAYKKPKESSKYQSWNGKI